MQRVRALLSRSLSQILGWLASRSPRIAFFVVDTIAGFLAIVSTRHTRAGLRSLFPALSQAEAGRVLRRIWMTHMRTLLLGGWVRRTGGAPIRKLVRNNDAIRELRPPMIVSTFHIGPTFGLGVLSEWLQGKTLVLRGPQFPIDPAMRGSVNFVEGTDQQRAASFHRAIEQLRENGFILIALDPWEAPSRIAVPFLRGTLHLARGAFAMARIARVPIVPLVARWAGREIELVVGDPLPTSDDEQELAASAAKWLERYLVESPGELSYRILQLMREE